MEWADFAQWFRTEGYRKLWGWSSPPRDAPEGWTINRDFSVIAQIHNGWGEDLETIKAVIELPHGPRTMAWYREHGNRHRWNEDKGRVLKEHRSRETTKPTPVSELVKGYLK